jgi:hypothetical protein
VLPPLVAVDRVTVPPKVRLLPMSRTALLKLPPVI